MSAPVVPANRANAASEASALAEDYAALGQVTTRLLHDFKNQLGGLKLYASFLKMRLGDNAEAAGIVTKIVEGLDSMADNAALVGRLARPLELHCESGDLAELVRTVVRERATEAMAREITLIADLPAEALTANFDWQQMQVALSILVQRALSVSPAGSIVRVAAQKTEAKASLLITDYGTPLDEAQRQSFFSFLTHERLNKTALDLAYAARIVQAHNGEASVNSQPDGATVVTLALKLEI